MTKEQILSIGTKAKQRRELKSAPAAGKAQLNLKIDASLKRELMDAYKGVLTDVFEEVMVERLKKDGHLSKKDARKSS